MNRIKTVFVFAICALWISGAKASLQMDWQNGTPQSVLPAGIVSSSDAITVQSENENLSVLNGAGNLASGSVSGGISAASVAFTSVGMKNGDEGGSFTGSGDIQFTTAVITPIPEPTSYALAFFGLAFVLGGVGHFCRDRLHRTRFSGCGKKPKADRFFENPA